MDDVIEFPTRPGAVPPHVRQGTEEAKALIRDLIPKAEKLGMARTARRLREINVMLGGEPLPVLRKVGVL